MNENPTRWIPGTDLTSGQTLIGESGGTSLINEVARSSTMPGLLAVNTEHGPLYLDPDEEYEVAIAGE